MTCAGSLLSSLALPSEAEKCRNFCPEYISGCENLACIVYVDVDVNYTEIHVYEGLGMASFSPLFIKIPALMINLPQILEA